MLRGRRSPVQNGRMKVGPLGILRSVVLLAGAAAGVMLVRALDAGLAGSPRALATGHLLLGIVLAAAVMPGPILGAFLAGGSSEKARGLAVGGSAVTALAAVLGGAFLWPRVTGADPTPFESYLALGWCVLALPLAAVDWWRLRGGERPGDPAAPGGDPAP